MIKRKRYNNLLQWKESSQGSTALLVEGARRVGKSTLVEEFAKQEYQSYILIDFAKVDEAFKNIFLDNRNNLDNLFMYLSAYYGIELHERQSVIILDEVQRFPSARELVKYLVEDGRYDYIETGSLISIKKNVENIVIPSEEDSLTLCPLDFEEFLGAVGQEPLAKVIRTSFETQSPLPEALHRKALMHWREYLLVGGMPQAVNEYVESKDLGKVDAVKRRILRLYREDIAKFAATTTEEGRLFGIFDSIPGQLSKHEKRFSLAAISPSARSREFDGAFFWLADAQIVNLCFNTTDPTVGLAMNQDLSTLKCYMADTGLLASLTFADSDTTPDSLYRDILFGNLNINEGMLVENMVAQQLKTAGKRLFYFSRNDADPKKRMEIDFLISCPYENANLKRRVSPVEVKSGKGRYATASLDKFKSNFKQRVGVSYILHPKNLRIEDERVYLPLYMSHLL
jgi:hypothetical protein